MKFYRFYGYICGEVVAGIVKASNKLEAEKFLRKTYYDYDLWRNKTLEEVIFTSNNVIEVYYGC